MNQYTQYQTANAIGDAARNPGGLAGAGVGLGAALAMANQMAGALQQGQSPGAPPPGRRRSALRRRRRQQQGPSTSAPCRAGAAGNLTRSDAGLRQGWPAGSPPRRCPSCSRCSPPCRRAAAAVTAPSGDRDAQAERGGSHALRCASRLHEIFHPLRARSPCPDPPRPPVLPDGARAPAGRGAGRPAAIPLRQVRRPLDFDPAQRAPQCPYCGHTEVIDPGNQTVRERGLDEYWRNAGGSETVLAAAPRRSLHHLRRRRPARRQGGHRQMPLLRLVPGEQAAVGRGHDPSGGHPAVRRHQRRRSRRSTAGWPAAGSRRTTSSSSPRSAGSTASTSPSGRTTR